MILEIGYFLLAKQMVKKNIRTFKIKSFVIVLNLSTGPVLKYSSVKTNIETINKVNKENFLSCSFF